MFRLHFLASALKLLHLRETIPWFGGHSGYEQLTRNLPAQQEVWTVKPRSGQLARYAGSAYERLQGRYGRGATSLSELEFRLQRKLRRPDASHVLYLEHHLDMLRAWPKAGKDLIGSVHLPAPIWKPEQCELLARLNSALVLYQRDIPFFEKYVGKGRVRFIHHGADVDFFKPDLSKRSATPRILYSGVYLRNEAMLVRVAERVLEKFPAVKFDLLVPVHHRQNVNLKALAGHPSVTWHAGLNDEQLRELYQNCHLLMLPMNDSGANTAVVESMTSGLPVATTDVGGIRDYGGGDIYPLVANHDDDAMVALVEQYLSEPEWRDEIGGQCRRFAEQKLAWPLVAEKHLESYRALIA